MAGRPAKTEAERKAARIKATKARQAVEERRKKALDLRMAGATYEEIARTLKFANKGGAWKTVEAALSESRKEKADQVMELELARLDRMQRQVFLDAIRGDTKAIAAMIRIMDRRAKYLSLDNPTLTDAVTDGVTLLTGLASQMAQMPDTYGIDLDADPDDEDAA